MPAAVHEAIVRHQIEKEDMVVVNVSTTFLLVVLVCDGNNMQFADIWTLYIKYNIWLGSIDIHVALTTI